jgi:cytoskeletal protein CcmA (bactofilin family)
MRTIKAAPDFGIELQRAEAETKRLSRIKNLAEEDIRSLIPSGMSISGAIHSMHGLKIDGRVAGSVEIEGDGLLVISPGAEILGSIKAKRALVMGTVHGGVTVDSLVVHRQGRLNGDIKYLSAKMATEENQTKPEPPLYVANEGN